VPDTSDRVSVAPRRGDEVEQVEMADWVSGWLAVGSVGDPAGGYAHLAEGPLGQVIASFTLMLAEGFGSSGCCPVTERFLRYDPARNSVDYLAYVEEFIPSWSLEGAAEVGDDFAADFDESWPAVIFQHLIDAYPDLDVYALSPQQAQDMGWPPYAEDPNPPPLDHLWRPVDPTAD
jgi:hypothetical protein